MCTLKIGNNCNLCHKIPFSIIMCPLSSAQPQLEFLELLVERNCEECCAGPDEEEHIVEAADKEHSQELVEEHHFEYKESDVAFHAENRLHNDVKILENYESAME